MTSRLVLNSLWIGPTLPALCQLCLASALAVGHRVRLFVYGPVADVPAGVEVLAADDILPRDSIVLHRRTGSPAFFSDRFRITLIAKGLGLWTDTDVLYLKPIDIDSPNIFAWEDHRLVGSSVLGLDHTSSAFASLFGMVHDLSMLPPWYPAHKRLWYRLRAAAGSPHDTANLPWGVIGPDLITWWVKNKGLERDILPRAVFYPVSYGKRRDLHSAAKVKAIRESLSPSTIAIHLWHQGLLGGTASLPAKHITLPTAEDGSFVHEVAKQLGEVRLLSVAEPGSLA